MHKKYHEEFKILDILAVTTQAHEGIETTTLSKTGKPTEVTTQAHEGIETLSCRFFFRMFSCNNSSP